MHRLKNLKIKKSYKFLGLAVVTVAAFVISLIPESAYATNGATFQGSIGPLNFGFSTIGGGTGSIGDSLCAIVDWFTGADGSGMIGSAIASLAVIFMGIAAFFGKVTWGMAITTACGIFAIFGASDIIDAILPQGSGFTEC